MLKSVWGAIFIAGCLVFTGGCTSSEEDTDATDAADATDPTEPEPEVNTYCNDLGLTPSDFQAGAGGFLFGDLAEDFTANEMCCACGGGSESPLCDEDEHVLNHTCVACLSGTSNVRFLIRTRHERLVMFLGCGIDDEAGCFLVTEFMDGGSLDRALWSGGGSSAISTS